jgi:signal transduction histidine kinase
MPASLAPKPRFDRPDEDLARQAERRTRLLQAANQVGQQIASIRTLKELLSKTVDIICDVYGFYYAGVFLLDDTGRWAVLRAGRGRAGAAMLAEGHKLTVGGNSMVGTAIDQRQARIALDVGEEAVHFKNPHLPDTRSEMALPLVVGDRVLGAVTVQSVEENAFSADDIATLQTMANYLAMAVHNTQLLGELKEAHAELLRTKTFEAIATTTGEAIHWVGNKAAPIPGSAHRVRDTLYQLLAVYQVLLAEPPETRRQHPFWVVVKASFDTAVEQGVNLAALLEDLARFSPQQLSSLVGLESILEDLEIIEQSANTILSIKEDLIGPMRLGQIVAISLSDLLNRTIASMGLPDGVVQTDFADGLPPVRGDPRQVERVFINLIKNAWEALDDHPQPQILVSAQRVDDPNFILVQVHDNGSGIPLEMLDKIWVSFYTTKGDRGGTGLGLSACAEIITQTGGKIWLDSSQPGVGTTFAVLLPVAKA